MSTKPILRTPKPLSGAMNRFRSEFLGLLLAFSVIGRLLPHPANMTPVGGLAIWSGTRLSKLQSVGLVTGSMFIADFFIGFHWAMPQVYVTLIITTLAAHWLQPKTVAQISLFTLISATVFFLTTNLVFYPWQASHMYSRDWVGQINAYIAALPFLRNSLIGDSAYTALFFSLEWAVNYLGERKTIPLPATPK